MTAAEPALSPTQWITAQMIYETAAVLAEPRRGMSAREIWAEITQRLPDIEREWDRVRSGTSTALLNLQWYSVDLVKAGWLYKSGGEWFLTPVGRTALRDYPDAARFFRRAREQYRSWDRNRDGFTRASRLVEGVLEGYWVAAPDLAAESDLEPIRLLHWLQGERPDGWHRVLDSDGGLPDAVGLDPDDRQQWQHQLDRDGLHLVIGRADATKRVPAADLRQLLEEASDVAGETARRAWLVRGSNVQGENLVEQLWLPEGVCSLPATRLGHLGERPTAEQVTAAVERDYGHASSHDRARQATEYYAFLSRMQDNDIVVTNTGGRYFLGVITGAAAFVTSARGNANLQRPVDWRNSDRPVDLTGLPDELPARVGNPDAALIELTEFVGDLEELLGEERGQPAKAVELTLPDATPKLATDLLFPQPWLQEKVEMLRDWPQMILYGPPGTGKTYLAQKLAEHIAGGRTENVQLVQFHPSYSYEDFFMGFRPREAKDGSGVAFALSYGPMFRLVDAARAKLDEPFVLVIDEINRANLAKVFGELYFLLEYRQKGINLLYSSDDSRQFTLPPNLLMIGTMNTVDRSTGVLDAAMRRRFWFVELHPSEEPVSSLLSAWLGFHELPDTAARLLAELNTRIPDRDFRIGPSYLMRPAIHHRADGVDRVWHSQILPLLAEHHYDDGADVEARYGLAALRATLGLPAADSP